MIQRVHDHIWILTMSEIELLRVLEPKRTSISSIASGERRRKDVVETLEWLEGERQKYGLEPRVDTEGNIEWLRSER